jgi:hypothetical protein
VVVGCEISDEQVGWALYKGVAGISIVLRVDKTQNHDIHYRGGQATMKN